MYGKAEIEREPKEVEEWKGFNEGFVGREGLEGVEGGGGWST